MERTGNWLSSSSTRTGKQSPKRTTWDCSAGFVPQILSKGENIKMMIDFSSDIPEHDLYLLLDLGKKHGFDPLSSADSEQYFADLLQHCNVTGDKRKKYLESKISEDFKFNVDVPRWIQDPEWPFDEGKPMLFVGQIELEINRDGNRFTNVFYVFWSMKTGETTTICQSD